MSNKAFIDKSRIDHLYRPVGVRVGDFAEVEADPTREQLREQAERCMNCGIPFCLGCGCPLYNAIPDMNAAVARGDWREAWAVLSATSDLPEFPARICPALCEGSCTASLPSEAVMIRQIEKAIVEKAFAMGLVKPVVPKAENGLKASVVGSGPGGLAAAIALRRRGYAVTVYERAAQPGGLLRYGIPFFKLDKRIIDRRIEILRESGIGFVCGVEVGRDLAGEELARRSDVVAVAIGTPAARDLAIPGRDLAGIHLALEFLGGQNQALGGEIPGPPISAKGRRVLVIGGGDTGSECVGTSNRHGAESVTQIEIMPKPSAARADATPWPDWPAQMRTSSSHEEGCLRRWSLNSLRFLGEDGRVSGVEVCQVTWELSPAGRPLKFTPVEGTREVIPCDLVLLALGFVKQDRATVLGKLGIPDSPTVVLVGDAALGPSLVVRALAQAKEAVGKMA